MGFGDDSEGANGLDAYLRTAEFRTVLAVAEAWRREFGIAIDAQPGGEGNEAGVVNRAFREAARVILGGVVSPGDDPAAVLTRALRQAALRRLAEVDLDEWRAEGLLDSEPALGDHWLAYLALAPASVVVDLLP